MLAKKMTPEYTHTRVEENFKDLQEQASINYCLSPPPRSLGSYKMIWGKEDLPSQCIHQSLFYFILFKS
jgi:hypothetical protein